MGTYLKADNMLILDIIKEVARLRGVVRVLEQKVKTLEARKK